MLHRTGIKKKKNITWSLSHISISPTLAKTRQKMTYRAEIWDLEERNFERAVLALTSVQESQDSVKGTDG